MPIKALDSSRNGGTGYGMCEGDCDHDSDCDAGLKCFQRDGYESVPGCSGKGKKDYDYCTNVGVKALDSSRNGGTGYGMCEGDCDKDSDCDAGLKCFQRVSGSFDLRVFPGVREVVKAGGITASIKST